MRPAAAHGQMTVAPAANCPTGVTVPGPAAYASHDGSGGAHGGGDRAGRRRECRRVRMRRAVRCQSPGTGRRRLRRDRHRPRRLGTPGPGSRAPAGPSTRSRWSRARRAPPPAPRSRSPRAAFPAAGAPSPSASGGVVSASSAGRTPLGERVWRVPAARCRRSRRFAAAPGRGLRHVPRSRPTDDRHGFVPAEHPGRGKRRASSSPVHPAATNIVATAIPRGTRLLGYQRAAAAR